MISRITYARVAGALLVFAALLCFTPPAEPSVRLCGFHWLTGRECPLCGITRALFALAKGHLSQAIRFNALSPLGFTMLFALILDAPRLTRLWTFGLTAFTVYGLYRVVLP